MAALFRLSYIPNAICALRIVLIVPIVILLTDARYEFALILIIVAGLSDGLDGFLAKNFDWRTRLGGLLDPLADKLLLTAVFITLAYIGLAPVWLAVVVLARDVVIVSGAVAYQVLIGPVQPNPSRVSKLNTALQLMFILIVIANQAFGWPLAIAITITGAGVLVASLVSGLDYVLRWSSLALHARSG